MRRALLAMTVCVLSLAACGEPDYYLLPPPQAAVQQPSPVSSVVVADINLPTYADAIEIASLSGPGTVSLANKALWADEPRRALTRQLAGALEARLRARVSTEPWPGFDTPGLRVEVTVDRLIGAPGGRLDLDGQFAVVSPSDGRIRAADRFAVVVPVQDGGYPALLAAHAAAIDALADRIVARITGRPLS